MYNPMLSYFRKQNKGQTDISPDQPTNIAPYKDDFPFDLYRAA